jgi:hypothetical protein
MILLQAGSKLRALVYQNPTQIDRSKIKIELIEEETRVLELLRLYSYKLDFIRGYIKRVDDLECDFIVKDFKNG